MIKPTRTKKYGKIGDVFYVVGRKIKCMIMGVERLPLNIIMLKFYKQEGFNSPNGQRILHDK